MLGPFRVRNLNRYPSRPTPSAHNRRYSNSDTVVCVDGDRYDGVVRSEPCARLRYLDTDLDVVTIGSKEELADRLADPVPPLARTRPPHAVPVRSPGMHVFDLVEPGGPAVKIWKEIEKETAAMMRDAAGLNAENTSAPAQTLAMPASAGGNPLQVGSALESTRPTTASNVERATKDKHQADGPEADQLRKRHELESANLKELFAARDNASSLEERRFQYFRHCEPPQAISSGAGVFDRTHASRPQLASYKDFSKPQNKAASVLTTHGMDQAREEGAKLRARLSDFSKVAHFYASNTSRPENRWATYSQSGMNSKLPVASASVTHEEMPQALGSMSAEPQQRGSAAAINPSEKHPSLTELFNIYQPEDEAKSHRPASVPSQKNGTCSCALNAAFYQDFQSRLAKLGATEERNLDEPRTGSNAEEPKDPHSRNSAIPGQEQEQSSQSEVYHPTIEPSQRRNETKVPNVDLREPLEVMVSKMIAHCVENVQSELSNLNGQIREHVLPRVPEEVFKLKGYPDPEQTKEMWRHLESLKTGLQTFGSEMDPVLTDLLGIDGQNLFPEGSGMIDAQALRSRLAPLETMATAVKKLVEHTLKDTIPVHDAAAENSRIAEYRIPKRLLASEYQDIWSITLGNLECGTTEERVRIQIQKARGCHGLPVAQISSLQVIEYVSGCHATVDILGREEAVATWNALFAFDEDPSFPQPLSMKRQVYPDVYRPQEALPLKRYLPLKPATKATPESERGMMSSDAKLKSIQERRAAWRKEYKARASTVRFKEPVEEPQESQSARIPETRPAVSTQTDPRTSNALPITPLQQPSEQANVSMSPVTQHGPSSYQAVPQGRYESSHTGPAPKLSGKSEYRKSAPHAVRSWQTHHHTLRPAGSMATLHQRAREATMQHEPRTRRSMPLIRTNWSAPQPLEPNVQVGPGMPPDLLSLCGWKPLNPIKLSNLPRVKQPQDESSKQETQNLPGAWPEEKPATESSGAFARRMMGRSPAASHLISPISSPKLKATEPRPPQPGAPMTFLDNDGHFQTGLVTRPGSELHRRSTVSDLPQKSAGGSWSRRPYSMTFDGSGRVTSGRSGAAGGSHGRHHTTSQPYPPADNDAKPSRLPSPLEHTKAENDNVEHCVSQLKELGYGCTDYASMERLLIYAESTKGNLEEAIDLIEEEREAWEQQGLSHEEYLKIIGQRN